MMSVKKVYIWAGVAVLTAMAVMLGWRFFAGRKNTAIVFENGSSRPLDRDEARRMQKQLALPGDNRPVVAATAAVAVQKNLDTINQVNRINQMNKKQNR